MIASRTSRLGALVALLTLASMASSRVLAQTPRREPTPNDTLKSTEVSSDHTVTFRIYAPKASAVTVSGEFGSTGKMTRDDEASGRSPSGRSHRTSTATHSTSTASAPSTRRTP